jgi:hypothetical protein
VNKTQAKSRGLYEGSAAAMYCIVDDMDRREAGCGCVAPAICEECLRTAAYESEMHARDFSPWEFVAAAINGSGDRAEGLWEAYEEGVGKAITKGVKKRLKNN